MKASPTASACPRTAANWFARSCRANLRPRAASSRATSSCKVNGRDVTPDETVSYIIANTSVGTRVPLEIIRDGRRQTVQVQVGQRPTEEELAKQAGGGAGSGSGARTGGAGCAGHCARPFAPAA